MSEGKLKVQEREVVVPGEIIAEGMSFLPGYGTYRAGDNVVANQLGLLNIDGKVLKTVPLSGRYLPKRGDVIIGKVIDILMSGWRLDINSPYTSVLPVKDATFNYIAKGADLTKFFKLEDYVVCAITNVTTQKLIDVTCKDKGLHKLSGGRIINVNTNKVPRIIGKRGSMVSLIKRATGCKITVGQNGIAWVSGEPKMEIIAINAIRMIEEFSHISGLTEKIHKFLEKETGTKIDMQEDESRQRNDDRNDDDNKPYHERTNEE